MTKSLLTKRPITFRVRASKSFFHYKAFKSFQSEYDMSWHMLNDDYSQFYLVGEKNGRIVGGYDTRQGQRLFGIEIGASSVTVANQYGDPIQQIIKSGNYFKQTYLSKYGHTTHCTYFINGKYVTFFYDIYANNTVRSILWVTQQVERSKKNFFAQPSSTLRDSYEEMMLHLMNEARVTANLDTLVYTPQYNATARAHSLDMIQNNYFGHKDQHGNRACDRMDAGGISFYWFGENLAYGQYSAIYAHEALMNSLSHRQNILREQFTHSFVGVQFTSTNIPYFTVNFYSES